MPPYVWPALLVGALLVGILGGFLVHRSSSHYPSQLGSRLRYFHAGACAEAAIAICSGALLWIGCWDLMDSYLVPVTWWAKLCMLCVGALGAFATRSLYEEQGTYADGTSVACDGGVEDGLAPALPADLSPRPRSLGASRLAQPMPGQRRCFLQPPKFSCSKCARALLATFAGLTMWVGLWDLLDAHILPTLVTACSDEPSAGCAAVKLILVAIGALGLYLTRSLYGDAAGSGPVQFQRL